VEILRQLRCFTRTGFGYNNEDLVLCDGIEDFLTIVVDGEGFTGFFDAFSCVIKC
jgi:hypothetical protein